MKSIKFCENCNAIFPKVIPRARRAVILTKIVFDMIFVFNISPYLIP